MSYRRDFQSSEMYDQIHAVVISTVFRHVQGAAEVDLVHTAETGSFIGHNYAEGRRTAGQSRVKVVKRFEHAEVSTSKLNKDTGTPQHGLCSKSS